MLVQQSAVLPLVSQVLFLPGTGQDRFKYFNKINQPGMMTSFES